MHPTGPPDEFFFESVDPPLGKKGGGKVYGLCVYVPDLETSVTLVSTGTPTFGTQPFYLVFLLTLNLILTENGMNLTDGGL